MNFIESLKFLFLIQSGFQLSVLDRKNGFKPSKKSIRILMFFIIFIISYIGYVMFMLEKPEEIKNPDGQKITLTNDTGNISATLAIPLTFMVWISTLLFRRRESTFYSDLMEVDKKLLKFDQLILQTSQQSYLNHSRALLLPILLNIIITCYVFMDDRHLNAPAMILFGLVFEIIQITEFMTSTTFYFNIKLLRDRFCLVKRLSERCYTMSDFEELETIHKKLINIMDDGINNSMGIKVGFVLLSNFLNSVTFSYTIFVGFITPYNDPNVIYYNIFGVVLPHMIMMIMCFLSGEWITINIKDSLHALTVVPVQTEEATALKRKLLLKMRALKFGISAIKIIPLNLKVLFSGFNVLATYFVILLQFRTLMDTSFLAETTN